MFQDYAKSKSKVLGMKMTLKTIHSEIEGLNRLFSERMSEMIRSFAAVHVRIDQLGQRMDAGFNQVDARFVTLKAEIINEVTEVFVPYTNGIERMLDDHERRIVALEYERRPPGNA
jgi:hypothetical protein